MTYKIIDFYGDTIAEGFRNKQSAKNELSRLKIHKKDKLDIVEEWV